MMRQEEIDNLLLKYERGECSVEESVIVEAFLAEAENEFIPGYSDFVEGQRSIESPASVMHFVEEDNIDALLLEQEANIDGLYADFISATQAIACPLEVDIVVAQHEGNFESLLTNQALLTDQQYTDFIQNERNISLEIDVLQLIAEHEATIDNLLHEQETDVDAIYREFIVSEREIQCDIDVMQLIGEKEAKVVPMRTTDWRRLTGIAAIFITVLCAVFLFRTNIEPDPRMANAMTEQERVEAEEALEYTLAALGMTKNKMDKGTQNLKLLRELEHTNIYK